MGKYLQKTKEDSSEDNNEEYLRDKKQIKVNW